MTTTWSPAPYIAKQEWLLSDGSIVTSPDFEATSTGRRVRVAGTTESFGSKQATALIERAIDKIATDRGTSKLIRLYTSDEDDQAAVRQVSLDKQILSEAVTLHLLQENMRGRSSGSTTAFWKFKVPDMPIFGYVFISLFQVGESYTIRPRVVFRNTHPSMTHLSNIMYDTGSGAVSPEWYRYSNQAEAVTKWMLTHFPDDDDLIFYDQSYTGQMRTAVVRFAELCKKFDNLDNITLPDLRKGTDVDDIESFTMKRFSSNYSASFHNELLAFVQTGPVIERIKETYHSLLNDLKTLGISIAAEAGDNAFAAAIQGDKTALQCAMVPNEDIEKSSMGLDGFHTVVLDLASGSMIVNCTHNNNLNEVAEAWEIAKFKAEMTGEVDVLMEYAKAYQNPKEQKRLLKIISQRAVPDE